MRGVSDYVLLTTDMLLAYGRVASMTLTSQIMRTPNNENALERIYLRIIGLQPKGKTSVRILSKNATL